MIEVDNDWSWHPFFDSQNPGEFTIPIERDNIFGIQKVWANKSADSRNGVTGEILMTLEPEPEDENSVDNRIKYRILEAGFSAKIRAGFGWKRTRNRVQRVRASSEFRRKIQTQDRSEDI